MRLYIDCNAKLGRSSKREPLVPYCGAELAREMRRCVIHAAVVDNNQAADYSYVYGNAELDAECAANERLYWLAACPPTYKWEAPEGANYLINRLNSGARGVLTRPVKHRHELDAGSLEEIARILTERGLPLAVYCEEAPFNNLKEVLTAFPALNILLLNNSWGNLRQIFPLLDKHKNLYIDIGGNQANDLCDKVAEYFGADRMVYSSGYPSRCMAGIKTLIEYASMSETDKDLVAYKNACRLFKIDETSLVPYESHDLDEMELAITEGRPLNKWTVLDAHSHVIDERDATAGVMLFNGDADNIAVKIKRLGIQKTAFSAWEGLYGGGKRANETVARAMEKYPGLFVGYATANPRYDGDIEDAIDCLKNRGFSGIKPYSQTQGLKFTDPRYAPWFEYGDKHKHFALIHSSDQETANQINEIAPKYPDLYFLMAHSGSSWEAARINLALAKKHGNVMLELTYTAMTRGVVEFFVKEIGGDRVFFGTDLAMRDPGPQLAWVVFAEIPFEDKLKILGGNMKKMLDRIENKKG